MSQLKMDILGELPLEIAEIILLYLNPEDLVNSYSVSTRWRQLVNNDRVWVNHMSYQKYVEKYWQYELGESYDEGEGCRLMNRYLTESRIKNNMKQGNYNVITRVFPSLCTIKYCFTDSRGVRFTDSGLFLSNGDELKFKDPPDIDLKQYKTILSLDLKLLAISCENFVYIYERKPPTLEFELLSLLAGCLPTGEELDGSTMISVVSCPKLDKESVASFLRKYRSGDRLVRTFVTSVDSPTERLVCLQIEENSYVERRVCLWDVDRNRLVHRWKYNWQCDVMEGWDGRGFCIVYDVHGGTDNRIEFYDAEMRPLTVIHIKGYRVKNLIVSYNFSVAAIESNSKQRLVMWEKDSTEYRVLDDKFCGYLVAVSPSTVAYLHDNNMTIIAVPHWQVLARVECNGYNYFSLSFQLTEYSDGSLFVIIGTEKLYIWHDIERRNTTQISELPISSGHKLKLPADFDSLHLDCLSQIVVSKGAKLVCYTENRMTIIDYNK